jgi:hypothetical protein
MNTAPDAIAEAALIELSRLLRTTWDHSMLRRLELLEAGVKAEEANAILADVAGEPEEMERAA